MRKMIPQDWKMVCNAMEDYPYTSTHGWVTPEKIDGYMRRWEQQAEAYVLEVDGKAVGFMVYQMRGVFLEIRQAAVIPSQRGKGHFKTMYKWVAKKLRDEGHRVAFFTVLEGSRFILDRFTEQGEGEGASGKVFYGTTDGVFE